MKTRKRPLTVDQTLISSPNYPNLVAVIVNLLSTRISDTKIILFNDSKTSYKAHELENCKTKHNNVLQLSENCPVSCYCECYQTHVFVTSQYCKPAISVKSPQQNIFWTVLTAVFYLSSCSHVMMMVTFDTTWSLIKLRGDTQPMTR